jgi:hypothetical protein
VFQLRDEHVRALASVSLENFEIRGAAFLRELLANQTASDAELRARIRNSIPRAAEYRLTSERQVIAFAATTYLVGNRFDTEAPWAAHLLGQGEMDPDMKAQWLLSTAMMIA